MKREITSSHMRNQNVNEPMTKGRRREKMKMRCMHKDSDPLDMNGSV